MTPSRLFFISFSSFCALVSSKNFAQEVESPSFDECPIPVYQRIGEDILLEDPNNIKILSDGTIIKRDDFARFSGGVTLIKSGEKLIADDIEINEKDATLTASGDIHFQNKGIDVFAHDFRAQERAKSTSLSNTSYQLQNNAGHGTAGTINIDADGEISLLDSIFTTCYGETADWQIKASEINLSDKDNNGEAKHARFQFYGVPLLYMPYFTFPLNNERKTGFLNPNIGSSTKSGLDIEAPFYWNIAENMDATITPHLMSKRGVRMLTEFRYLSGLQGGQIDVEYLHSDRSTNNDDARYLARLQHTGTFSEDFRIYVDYTTISDDNYLNDIGSKHYNSNDAYLYQIGELSYFADYWQTTMKYQDFEILGNHTSTYRTEPQIDFSFHRPLPVGHGTFDIYAELSRFRSVNPDLQAAERYHVEAGLTVPMSTPAWFFNSELRFMHTYYRQDVNNANSPLEEDVSRTLPKVRFHGGINFERNLFLNSSYTQTFEPQLQYLYIPNVDQSNIGIYDTTQLQDDYEGLFRDRRFSGLDRIAQANQLSWGLTTRILDEKNLERFRLSLGQISYLNDSNTDVESLNYLYNSNVTEGQTDVLESANLVEQSALAAELFFHFDRQWQFSGDLQYDTDNKAINKSQLNLDYHYTKKTFMQLNHRYTRNVSGNKLEQISGLASIEINNNWQFVGRITQDVQDKRTLEAYTGFQYDSCCWAVQFAYHKHINSYFEEPGGNQENRDEFDSGFVIQFILKGLSKDSLKDTTNMLNTSIFGYKRPYFLNN